MPAGAVYIGRACPGLKGSPFRNPFPVKTHGRAEALRLFRRHLVEHPELVEQARRELAGKDLACWCRLGEACHGDVWLDVLAEGEPYGAAAGSGTMGPVTLVTLGEWAAKVGRAETAVRNHLTAAPGFPAPKGTRPREGSGTGVRRGRARRVADDVGGRARARSLPGARRPRRDAHPRRDRQAVGHRRQERHAVPRGARPARRPRGAW
ncbi:DUF4326 domain-containing protein [Nonomuraea sp. NPDC046570]|uniref:DUF4326 domain-containing protein n=1 Tax=Nonomuraea sp. NPDC046570 TaxID=3155255 RepID=UPI0033DAF1B5